MDGNFQHQNTSLMKFVIFSNHVAAEDVFFHWFILVLDSTTELVLSTNTLLIFPMLVFEGFNILNDTWWGNSPL